MWCLITFVIFEGATISACADYFVVTNTKTDQKEAQKIAVEKGGWVLPALLYPKLKIHGYAVVRGPFSKIDQAKKELHFLKSDDESKDYQSARIIEAGKCVLELVGGVKIKPQILATLLGEIAVNITEQSGGANPCEPQEPFYEINLSYMGAERKWNEKTQEDSIAPGSVDVDVKGFWIIKRTDAIERMRICTE
jgi:hypothetical protein